MKGWILYHKKQSALTQGDYGVNRLLEEAKKLNIELEVYSPEEFELIVSRSDRKSISINGDYHSLPQFLIPRMGSATTYFALAVMRQLEDINVYTCNHANAIEVVKDKLHIHQLLAQSDLPTPKTMLLKFPIDLELVEKEIGFPLIVKNVTGTNGKGIFLCEDAEKLEDLMDLVCSYNQNFNIIIQEYVSFKRGEDLRVFTLGGKVVGSMKRKAKGTSFKANYSIGGKVEAFPINEEIERLALETTRLLNLEMSGIDILFDQDGYKVLEANSAPGFKGMEEATNKNIAKEILEFIKTKCTK